MVFPIVGGNQSSGDIVTNSLLFNNDDSAYLEKSLSSPNTDKFTVAFWVKISGQRANVWSIGKRLTGETGDYYALTVDLGTGTGTGRLSVGGYNGVADSNTLAVNTAEGSGSPQGLTMRDVSAWQHHVYAFDTGQASAGDRFKWYVNGVLQSGYNTTTTPSQNVDLFSSSGSSFRIGRMYNDESRYMDGYLAEFYYVDGQQYDATYFGEFDSDSGIWVPVELDKGAGGAITFGTNGFYLQFKETGTSANASGIGADTSGNDNHFTPNNLAAVDVVTDTPQNNFCVLNAIDSNSNHTLSEGNTKLAWSAAAGNFGITKGTMGVSAGKWYWEVKYTYGNAGQFGFFDINDLDTTNTTDIAVDTSTFEGLAWRIDTSNNIKEIGTNQSADSGDDFSSGNILGIAFDADNGKLYGFQNGTEITGQDIANGTSLLNAVTVTDFYLPFISNGDGGSGTKTGTSEVNFGNPTFSVSSGNADANGHGNFEYAVPSGYFALCTKNLAQYG